MQRKSRYESAVAFNVLMLSPHVCMNSMGGVVALSVSMSVRLCLYMEGISLLTIVQPSTTIYNTIATFQSGLDLQATTLQK